MCATGRASEAQGEGEGAKEKRRKCVFRGRERESSLESFRLKPLKIYLREARQLDLANEVWPNLISDDFW